jgi:AraC-like DNA-binding protein
MITYQDKIQKSKFLGSSKEELKSCDILFLDSLTHKIEEQISNPDLSVTMLSAMLRVSHVNLYRKTKSITGLTVSEFIRNFRLSKAANLLKDGDKNVKEVMYDVGFNHCSYFSLCFKEMYGIPPRKYMA